MFLVPKSREGYTRLAGLDPGEPLTWNTRTFPPAETLSEPKLFFWARHLEATEHPSVDHPLLRYRSHKCAT